MRPLCSSLASSVDCARFVRDVLLPLVKGSMSCANLVLCGAASGATVVLPSFCSLCVVCKIGAPTLLLEQSTFSVLLKLLGG